MQSGQRAARAWLNSYRERSEERVHLENKEISLAGTLTIYVEMTDRGIAFEPINVMKSDATKFTVDPQTRKIIAPFAAIDSLGAAQAQKIVEERQRKPFESVEDFETRCHVSATISASLRALGAYEGLPESAQMTLAEFL